MLGGINMNISEKLRAYADTYKTPPFGREVEGTVEILEEAAERLDNANKRNDVLKRCICEYGAPAQVDMCIEEMSELTKALLKYRRKSALAKGENVNSTSEIINLNKAREDIIDELADVKIMCRQMELVFQVEDVVERRMDFKINRQIGRLEASK